MNENIPSNEKKPGSSKKLRFALLRCVAALLLAGALLAATGFSVIALLKGPTETTAIQDEEYGAFVYREIYTILGFYADDVASGDKVVGRYALVPMSGKLISVRFTNRYLESAAAVLSSTTDYINGTAEYLDSYVVVQGSVGTLSEENSALMYDWFGINRDQLIAIGMITDTDDYADYLSDYVLLVDTVDGYSQSTVITLTVIVGLLLLYMPVELVLMGVGFYLPKPETTLASGGKDDVSSAPESEGGAPEVLAESDGEDLGNPDGGEETASDTEDVSKDDASSAPESEGGEPETPAEADGEDLGAEDDNGA